MKKNILKSTLVVATLTIASYGGMKAYELPTERLTTTKLLLSENVEALTSGTDAQGGFTILNICSRKKGTDYCSAKRGHRKWAFRVRIGVANYSGNYNCTECPDDDYDIEEE